MAEHILFLTGKLAEKSLRRVLDAMQPTEFTWQVHQLGVSVAALMTAEMIGRRLKDTRGADRIIIPGRCRGDLETLSEKIGVPVERGPEELKDLPVFFGQQAMQHALDRYDIKILAEIVDAPERSVESIVERAKRYRQDGADIIDLGSLPETPFPHLAEAITALKEEDFLVSVDTLDPDTLLMAGKTGADYLLSLKEDTLWIADEVPSTPILIPEIPSQPESLYRSMEKMEKKGRAYIADPILDPIHTGFTDSIVRYHATRQRFPEAEIMMGIGNLTELTHADSAGVNATLLGIMSELDIHYMLATEVSPHCRHTIREADLARRIMYIARQESTPPRLINDELMMLHERKPYLDSMEEIHELATQIKDPSYRIQNSEEAIHIFNRDGFHSASDPFEFFPKLDVETDGSHAFYLGVELARAQIAWQLGKRYNQDEELNWGVAVKREETDLNQQKEAGNTLKNTAGKKKD